jgi:hypothetical protein
MNGAALSRFGAQLERLKNGTGAGVGVRLELPLKREHRRPQSSSPEKGVEDDAMISSTRRRRRRHECEWKQGRFAISDRVSGKEGCCGGTWRQLAFSWKEPVRVGGASHDLRACSSPPASVASGLPLRRRARRQPAPDGSRRTTRRRRPRPSRRGGWGNCCEASMAGAETSMNNR